VYICGSSIVISTSMWPKSRMIVRIKAVSSARS
jgi:hypothetical protein